MFVAPCRSIAKILATASVRSITNRVLEPIAAKPLVLERAVPSSEQIPQPVPAGRRARPRKPFPPR